MSFFDLDPTAGQNLMDQARLNPVNPEDMKPGWFAGTWKAPVTGLASAVNDAALLLGDAATPVLRSTVARPIDTLFGTKTEDWLIGQQQIARDNITAWSPDPRTTGVVGQAVHGIFNIVPEAVAGGPEVAALLQGYKGMQAGLQDGLDPGTAFGKGAIDGISTWVGLKIPMTLAPQLGAAGTIGTGAAGNLVTGMATRGATGELLRARGYGDMADQYKVLDGAAIATDLIMGGAFGALAHYGPAGMAKYKEWQKSNDGKLLSSDEQTALFLNATLHAELDTAPGIPTNPAARAAHAEALNKAMADLLSDNPVTAPDGVTQADFIDNPTATQTRAEIMTTVEEHLGPEWQQLKGELEARGLPGDTTLYQVRTAPENMAPVRPTAEVKGIIEKARAEGWDGERILSTLEGLAGRLEQRNAANLEARKGDRVRGELWMRERLTRAERTGELSPETVRLAMWLIDKNPNVVSDLALSIRGKGDAGVGGNYNVVERLVTLIKGRGDDSTAVHEILHHTERMLPEPVREGIRRAWLKELRAVERFAKTTQNQTLMVAVADALKAATGDDKAFDRVAEMIKTGEVSQNFYALVNPSEFWAETASKIIQGRAGAESWVAQAKQWLTEFIEKIKDAFGMRSDAAVIRGLNAVLKTEGDLSGNMLATNVRLYPAIRPGVEAPGVGVAKENLNGFEPDLRVSVPIGRIRLPEKPLVLTGTNKKNAARQVAAIDDILARFPNADASPLEWSKMMAYAMATKDVPVPPYRFLSDINSDGAFKSLSRLSAGQIADANHGFENARAFREAYIGKQLDVVTTGKMFLWSFLSRGVSPYTQEGLFIDAFPSAGDWIKKAAEGNFTEKDFAAYEAWAKSVAPQGSGQPGSGATHNLNAFGKLFLYKMGAKGEDGVSLLQKMHDMMEDPNMTGKELRRWFIQNTEGVGIDNKVVSFTMLVAGFDDVMVLDRVQIRQLWDDGRFGDRNLYDGRKVDGKPVAGSALSEITYGARGLLIYEAIERALAKRIENLYSSLGRPQDASIGRYHWETWVADSQQEASHGTLDAILADARGDQAAISNVTAKEGEYGGYAYGARYGRDANGQPYFLYTTPMGNEYRFGVGAFREFLEAVKLPANKVVPTKFKVTEAGNAPWYQRPEVNKPNLEALAQRFAGKPGAGEGAGAVRPDGQGEAVSDGAGRGADPYGADAAVRNNPSLTVPMENGAEVPAARALAQADAEIAKAQQDSQGYDAAVACALRG